MDRRAPVDAELVRFVTVEYHRVLRLMMAFARDRSVAEELTQEAMARAVQHWADVRRARSPSVWLTVVALNLARSRWRRRRVETRAVTRAATGSDRTTSADLSVDLRQALARLPTRQRDAVTLHHVLGYPIPEVAVLLSCSQNTVRTHVRRGLQRLREDTALQDN